jgi:adenosylhomocysteine nucleosidase
MAVAEELQLMEPISQREERLLIVVPLQEELDYFQQSCSQLGYSSEATTLGRLPALWLSELDIALALGGTGKAQFAVQTQHLLDSGAGWDLVICAGAAGALADGVVVGDVVVGTTTVEHDYDNKFSTRPRPRFEGAASAVASLRRVASPSGAFRVHFGTIASGDEDVVDRERGRSLHQATGALAVAWEGAGGARACRFSGVPFVEIRGVTDTADQDAPADFETNLAIAIHNVATLITSWLESG